jgi:hypothetical protein
MKPTSMDGKYGNELILAIMYSMYSTVTEDKHDPSNVNIYGEIACCCRVMNSWQLSREGRTA